MTAFDIKNILETNSVLRPICAPFLPVLRKIRRVRQPSLTEAYDQIFSHLTGTVVVRIPNLNGSFEMDCRSHITRRAVLTGKYEPEVADLIRQHIDPQKDAVDVGANVGLFSVLISSLLSPASRVLAIEPAPAVLSLLTRNVARNSCPAKVITFGGAATEKPGRFTLNVISGMEEYSSLSSIVHFAVKTTPDQAISVEGLPLDVLVERFGLQPGLIKLDTEGAEFHVLSGAVNTIRKYRPIVIAEFFEPLLLAHGVTSQMLLELFRLHDYVVTRYQCSEILALPRESNAARDLGSRLQVIRGT